MTTAAPDTRPAVLLTGFGPFPGVIDNASAHLVRALARRARRSFAGYRFSAAILPVEWERAPLMVAALHRRLNPVLALHFGVAASTRGFRIECVAVNSSRSAPDAGNRQPLAPHLLASACDRYPVTIDASRIVAAIAAKGYPTELSDDAGGYLCNAVLFHSLRETQLRGNRCRVGFVHIPADLAGSGLTRSGALTGALEIVKETLPRRTDSAALTSA